ncbi:unnamed protein product [Caenorhabditis sp. 36 PRJEB53466]|nr:unnamed protein product [Caenorhabditis sp. 36 PRJEB53466]
MPTADSNRFVPFVSVYFKIYLIGGLTFQCFLLFLILKKSPASLANLRFFLFNTCILHIFLISIAFFTQHRNLPNSVSLAVLPYGPCREFGPDFCFTAYHFFLGVALAVGLGISNTVLFRHRALRQAKSTRRSVVVMISLTYIPSLVIIILPFTAPWNFPEVRALTYFEHPSYDLSIYEPFVGFSNVASFQFLAATALLVFGAYAIPSISGLLTRRVVHLINTNRNMSPKTKDQSKTLAYGLAFQTFLPVVCYVPMPTSYIISQVFNVEILLTEHLLAILICLPSFLDPFISFYFIVPYRLAISNCFPVRKSLLPNIVSVRHLSNLNPSMVESN